MHEEQIAVMEWEHEEERRLAAMKWDAMVEARVDELIASDQKQRRHDLWLRGVL